MIVSTSSILIDILMNAGNTKLSNLVVDFNLINNSACLIDLYVNQIDYF